MKNKSLLTAFLIAAFAHTPNASAVKLNGADIEGEMFIYKNPKNAAHISFHFDKDGINVGTVNLNSDPINRVKTLFAKLRPGLEEIASDGLIDLSFEEVQGHFISGKEGVFIRSLTDSLEVMSCILESKDIRIGGHSLSITNTYAISATNISLISTAPDSIVKEIKIIPSSVDPVLLLGDIDFSNHTMNRPFVVIGAQEVWMRVKNPS